MRKFFVFIARLELNAVSVVPANKRTTYSSDISQGGFVVPQLNRLDEHLPPVKVSLPTARKPGRLGDRYFVTQFQVAEEIRSTEHGMDTKSEPWV